MIRDFIDNLFQSGLTIREISRRSGLPSSTVHRIYTGKTSPNLETAQKILNAFGHRLSITAQGETK